MDEETKFASIYKILASEIGVENTIRIHALLKGQQIVFPTKLYSGEYIQELIISLSNDGKTVAEIARLTGYSDRRIRQLLKNKDIKNDI